MQTKYILLGLLIVVPQMASAQTDCRLSDTLKRIHASSELMFENPVGGIMASNLRRIQAEMRFLNIDAVPSQIRDQLSQDEVSKIITHLRLMSDVATASAQGDQSMVQSALNNQRNLNMLRTVGPYIADLTCVPLPTQSQLAIKGKEDGPPNTSGIGTDQARLLAFISENGVFVALSSTVIAGILWAISSFVSMRIQRRRIRGKRHGIYKHVKFATGAVNHKGTLLDISRLGAKMRHNGSTDLEQHMNIKVLINNNWFTGKVAWTGEEYCGLRFSNVMTRAELKEIRQSADHMHTTSRPKAGLPESATK